MKWSEGKIINNHTWAKDLFSITVEAEVEPFLAGQFTRLALDINGERIMRPYSYVNAPDEQLLEFYAIEVKNGPFSPHLARLKTGDTIFVSPRGSGLLTLEEVAPADQLWLLATGTALGPFLSILKSSQVWTRYQQIVLVHSVRTAEELVYRDIITKLCQQHPGQLSYQPFVSREQTDFAIHGRVPAAISSGELVEKTGVALNTHSSQVMICGNPAMVTDTCTCLESMGFKLNKRRDPGNISVENYWK